MIEPKNRFQELDALRGIAALIVAFFHYTLNQPETNWGFKLGTTGVDLFFIISGFVIFMSLSKAKKGRDFIISRASRLYPTYWACVTFTFLLISLASILKHRPIELITYVGNLTMFQFYLKIGNLDPPYWTMVIEMNFYLGIFLLFKMGVMSKIKEIGFVLTLLVTIADYNRGLKNINLMFHYLPFTEFIPLFFAGILFYKIYTQESNQKLHYALIGFCLLCQIAMAEHAGRSHHFINPIEYGIMLSLYFLLFILFVNDKLQFVVSKATLYMGKISFAFYLIHQYLGNVIIKYAMLFFRVNFWVALLFFAIPAVIFVASMITYFIEVPMSRKMKLFLREKC